MVRESMDPLPDASEAALEAALDLSERVDDVASAVGSALVLTNQRLIVVREGANYRSVSGIRSFLLDRNLRIRIEPLRKRVIIGSARAMISVFVRLRQLERAEKLLAEIRRRIHSI